MFVILVHLERRVLQVEMRFPLDIFFSRPAASFCGWLWLWFVMFFFNVCVFSLGSWLRKRKRKEKGTKAGKTANRARRMYVPYRTDRIVCMYVVLKKLYATNFKLKLEKNKNYRLISMQTK